MATQTLQQLRAQHALKQVQEFVISVAGVNKTDEKKAKNLSEKFKARASELPFMIHTNGLGPALAFFKSKKEKDGYDKLYVLLQSWLVQPGRPFVDQPDLMKSITEADFNTYRLAQAEAIQYMDWVKKFASAYL